MRSARNALRILAAAGLLLWLAFQPALAQQPAREDKVLRGDAQCTRCHDETGEYPVLAIGKTKHGTRADGRTPTCTTCHGASETHVNKPTSATERPKPDRMFGRKALTPASEQNAACTACHNGGKRIHWQGSAHESRDVSCTSCHNVHAGHDRVRDKVEQAEVCTSCHKEQRNQIHRVSRHPTLEGKVGCSDCHNPHGTAGPKLLARDNTNDTCYQCHMEKRGPFVRTHQPVQEDCAICHNPHGSNNPNLLKHRPPWLCQQCHEPTGHRGTPGNVSPATANSTGQNTLARGCLNCHTNIHGTNNPRDISNERTFRR